MESMRHERLELTRRFAADAEAARLVSGEPGVLLLACLMPRDRVLGAAIDVDGLLAASAAVLDKRAADRRPVSVPGSVVLGRSCRLVWGAVPFAGHSQY